jgi:hypothetical protein
VPSYLTIGVISFLLSTDYKKLYFLSIRNRDITAIFQYILENVCALQDWRDANNNIIVLRRVLYAAAIAFEHRRSALTHNRAGMRQVMNQLITDFLSQQNEAEEADVVFRQAATYMAYFDADVLQARRVEEEMVENDAALQARRAVDIARAEANQVFNIRRDNLFEEYREHILENTSPNIFTIKYREALYADSRRLQFEEEVIDSAIEVEVRARITDNSRLEDIPRLIDRYYDNLFAHPHNIDILLLDELIAELSDQDNAERIAAEEAKAKAVLEAELKVLDTSMAEIIRKYKKDHDEDEDGNGASGSCGGRSSYMQTSIIISTSATAQKQSVNQASYNPNAKQAASLAEINSNDSYLSLADMFDQKILVAETAFYVPLDKIAIF